LSNFTLGRRNQQAIHIFMEVVGSDKVRVMDNPNKERVANGFSKKWENHGAALLKLLPGTSSLAGHAYH